MQTTVVLSSKLVNAVRYDAATRTLSVKLRFKGVRHFLNVPPDVFHNLCSAQSPGWYYTSNIRDAFKAHDPVGTGKSSWFARWANWAKVRTQGH